jgi:hypothetical protein
VGKQAAIAAISKVFLGIAMLTAAMMPIVFILRTPKRGGPIEATVVAE